MKTLESVLLALSLILVSRAQVFPQQKFFYAGDEKIPIKLSSTEIVVTLDTEYPDTTFTSWLNTSGLVDSYNLTISVLDDSEFIITEGNSKSTALRKDLKKNENLDSVDPVYETSEGAKLIVTDEILVQFKLAVSQGKIDSLIQALGLSIISTEEDVPNYYVLSVPPDEDPIEIANRLQESGMVEWSQPDFIAQIVQDNIIPNDPYFKRQFQLHNTGQEINDGKHGTKDAAVDAPEAWRISKGERVIVAVIDHGVDLSHPDFAFNRIVKGYDFLDDDNDPSPGPYDSHGTACAGIVGATQGNSLGITGIAPECNIMSIRVAGYKKVKVSKKLKVGTKFKVVEKDLFLYKFASNKNTAKAITFAWKNGAHILSNSWNYKSKDALFPVISAALDRAKKEGRKGLGCVVVFSAGNTANHNKKNDGYVRFPGNAKGVLTVGASDRDDRQANYSPTDKKIDIVAPSNTIDPEVWTTDITGNAGYNNKIKALPSEDPDYTGWFGGTSAACPLVAGIAALVLSKYPQFAAALVESSLLESADKIDKEGGGYKNGKSRRYGYGRVNAYRALLRAAEYAKSPLITNVSHTEIHSGKTIDVEIEGLGFDSNSQFSFLKMQTDTSSSDSERLVQLPDGPQEADSTTILEDISITPQPITSISPQPDKNDLGFNRMILKITVGNLPGQTVYLQVKNQEGGTDVIPIQVVP